MSAAAPFDPLAELRGALGEGDAQTTSEELGARIVAGALEARAPGRPLDAVAPAEPRAAFGRAVQSLDALLGSLRPEEWSRPAIRTLSVQGLVGHLIGVERAFAAVLGDPQCSHAGADHVESTDPSALAQAGRSPADTVAEWRAAVAETLEALRSRPAGDDRPLGLHGIRLPLGALLTVRTFELWTHEEDVRRATGRPLVPPDDATLRLMTDLAVTLVSAIVPQAGDRPPTRRLVLTGPAGGTWAIPSPEPDGQGRGAADAVVVMETVAFCRLVANRLDPGTLPATVSGDPDAADELFVAAASLALD